MKSYGQYCALARALDVVGDRWTLLIVRELGVRPCRYTDIRDGLPGIATNLLSDRLRQLEAGGIVTRRDAPPPVATTVYELTPHGRGLLPILGEFARWALPEMTRGLEGDTFRSRWLALAVPALTGGLDRGGIAPLRVRLLTDDEPFDVVVGEDGVTTELHATEAPDVTLTGPPDVLMGVLTGFVRPGEAEAAGVAVAGRRAAVSRLARLGERVNAALTVTAR